MRATTGLVMALVMALGILLTGAVGCAAAGPRPMPLDAAATAPAYAPPPAYPQPPAVQPVDSQPQSAPPPPASATSAAANPEPAPAPIRHPYHADMPSRAMGPDEPARRHANLSPAQCQRELRQRKLPLMRRKGGARGVANPLRISGPMHDVRFVAPGPPTAFGVLDCRFALALEAFAQALHEQGVAEVRLDNIYRRKARLGRRGKRSQHAYGLAADITALKLTDGRTLNVAEHWHAPIGATVCGPNAEMHDPNEEAILLRNIVCDVARQGIFHHMLTPSFNRAHRDHFHFDIKRGADYRSLR